ncbi:MAG: CopG family antitoxin [Candidatus Methanoperedens sp.]|nr:CopG family antitoxin [Candidatus Methanoperedens sp.]
MTKKIPNFKTLEEASYYWDTRTFAEYIEDTEPVEIEVNLKPRKLYLEIDNDLSEKLRKISQKKKRAM